MSDSSLYLEAALAAALFRALVWFAVAVGSSYWRKIRSPDHGTG
jgi:hypothetical protein